MLDRRCRVWRCGFVRLDWPAVSDSHTALPTGLGHGLHGVVSYEAAEVWSPEARVIRRQDALTGLVANTPLRLIAFGISVGDAGHRKVFITLGRWF